MTYSISDFSEQDPRILPRLRELLAKNQDQDLESCESRILPILTTGQAASGVALVGRRVMATYLDEEGNSQWYPALIVEHRPRARIYRYVIHFDADGEEILVGLPDDTVQLLTTTATHTASARAAS